jgi:hypothetical protein
MPSPFPGMNPYLEHRDFWSEIHDRFIVDIADNLIPQLVPKYIVSLNKEVYLTTPEGNLPVGLPDVTVQQKRNTRNRSSNVAVAVAAEPAKVRIPMPVEITHNYLEIKDAASKRVVTAIEILSPVNKRSGPGREKYLRKRQRIFGSLTNLIEIDLLRSAKPMPLVEGEANNDYRILVSRSDTRPTADMYAFNVQNQIPLFPVPLQPGDAEPVVNLKDLLDLVYDRARYDVRIDYSTEPVPRLSDGDAVWADGLLKELGLR